MREPLAPRRRPFPSKLFVEVTTACNLKCAMCVKQSGEGIPDEYMEMSVFRSLLPVFPSLESLILNGVGEPLLHPLLEDFIGMARDRLPPGGTIGFQTNGILLDGERALSLLSAGTDVICLSVDAEDPALFRSMREGGESEDVNRAALSLRRAMDIAGRESFRWGAEFVLTKRNMEELPRVVRWTAERGGSFVLVSHLLPYSEESAPDVAYDPNVDETLVFYMEKKQEALARGLDISLYLQAKWRFRPVERGEEVVAFMEDVLGEMARRGLPRHVPNLLAHDEAHYARMEDVFRRSGELAALQGVELRLPALSPRRQRRCDFIEEGSAFVAVPGTVHPCYFLWHSFVCRSDGRIRPVNALSFGAVREASLLGIWNGPGFTAYRDEIGRYEFPFCGNCSLAPCDYIERHGFEQDCLGNLLTCGSCPWSLGVLQCLR